MSCLLCSLALVQFFSYTVLTGQVVDPSGNPIPEARVFYEPGIGGALQVVQASNDGHFAFADIPLGGLGVFAIAPGWSYGGRHVTINPGEVLEPLRIVLKRPASLDGRVMDPRGDAIAGARITRIALLGEHMVGIPLAKLRAFNIEEPQSDSNGRFSIENLPQGGTVAVKAAHSSYAQESQDNIPVGSSNLRLTMYQGALIEGSVESRDQQVPVSNTAIIIRNAQPPHDTTTVLSDSFGRFSVRLKPGVYLYQAAGVGIMSPGWERLVVTGESPHPRMNLRVAGKGTIRGKVNDAVTGNPIPEVRITLMANGNVAALARTSASGAFQLEAAEGENRIRITTAPGYRTPAGGDTIVQLQAGENYELPDFWLAPLGGIKLHVLDEDATSPVPQAVISLLEPRQYGFHRSDNSGLAELRIQQIPDSGRIIGLAEDTSGHKSALFSIADVEINTPARVQLLSNGEVRGRVVNEAGRALSGLEVGGVYPGEAHEEPVLLWRTFSDANGNFHWPAQTPGVPMRCVVRGQGDQHGESGLFSLSPGEMKDTGNIVLTGGRSGKSMQGSSIRVRQFTALCPEEVSLRDLEGHPLLLCFVTTPEILVVENGLAHLRAVLGNFMPNTVLVITEPSPVQCEDLTFPVLRGTNPGLPTTYLLDADHKVQWETAGIPPVSIMRRYLE